jgi:hypothetical protein
VKLNGLLFALIVAFSLSACFGRATYHWKEEVLLHDGRVIVIERSVKTGYAPTEIGQPPAESDYTLTFGAPGGKTITWDGGRNRFIPMILDFEQDVPYVVATGATSLVYGTEGCPRPPYFFFRWSAGQWQRMTYEEFPKSIRKANLSAGLTYPSRDPMRERIGRGELVTKDDVVRLKRSADLDAREVREDKTNPCATWDNDFRYVPKE